MNADIPDAMDQDNSYYKRGSSGYTLTQSLDLRKDIN